MPMFWTYVVLFKSDGLLSEPLSVTEMEHPYFSHAHTDAFELIDVHGLHIPPMPPLNGLTIWFEARGHSAAKVGCTTRSALLFKQ